MKETDVVCNKKDMYLDWLIPKFLNIQKGSRLTVEHATKLIVRKKLTPQERAVFLEMLYNREKALAFNFLHCGKVCPEVTLPQIIKTVEHKA